MSRVLRTSTQTAGGVANLKGRVSCTLRLVREAIRVLEADPEMFRGAIERIETANESPLAIPSDKPDVILREIERVLASALERLEG